jgi:hypothetical protein
MNSFAAVKLFSSRKGVWGAFFEKTAPQAPGKNFYLIKSFLGVQGGTRRVHPLSPCLIVL